MVKVEMGSRIRLNFELRFSDGVYVDSNHGLEPVDVIVGDGILLEAVESELIGKTVNDLIHLTIPPDDGYGFADPSLIEEIPLDSLPPESRKVGAALTAYDDEGQERIVMVTEIDDDVAMVDFNHPYAGRTLCYQLEILDIK